MDSGNFSKLHFERSQKKGFRIGYLDPWCSSSPSIWNNEDEKKQGEAKHVEKVTSRKTTGMSSSDRRQAMALSRHVHRVKHPVHGKKLAEVRLKYSKLSKSSRNYMTKVINHVDGILVRGEFKRKYSAFKRWKESSKNGWKAFASCASSVFSDYEDTGERYLMSTSVVEGWMQENCEEKHEDFKKMNPLQHITKIEKHDIVSPSHIEEEAKEDEVYLPQEANRVFNSTNESSLKSSHRKPASENETDKTLRKEKDKSSFSGSSVPLERIIWSWRFYTLNSYHEKKILMQKYLASWKLHITRKNSAQLQSAEKISFIIRVQIQRSRFIAFKRWCVYNSSVEEEYKYKNKIADLYLLRRKFSSWFKKKETKKKVKKTLTRYFASNCKSNRIFSLSRSIRIWTASIRDEKIKSQQERMEQWNEKLMKQAIKRLINHQYCKGFDKWKEFSERHKIHQKIKKKIVLRNISRGFDKWKATVIAERQKEIQLNKLRDQGLNTWLQRNLKRGFNTWKQYSNNRAKCFKVISCWLNRQQKFAIRNAFSRLLSYSNLVAVDRAHSKVVSSLRKSIQKLEERERIREEYARKRRLYSSKMLVFAKWNTYLQEKQREKESICIASQWHKERRTRESFQTLQKAALQRKKSLMFMRNMLMLRDRVTFMKWRENAIHRVQVRKKIKWMVKKLSSTFVKKPFDTWRIQVARCKHSSENQITHQKLEALEKIKDRYLAQVIGKMRNSLKNKTFNQWKEFLRIEKICKKTAKRFLYGKLFSIVKAWQDHTVYCREHVNILVNLRHEVIAKRVNRIFIAWKQHISREKRIKETIQIWTNKRKQTSKRPLFNKWKVVVERKHILKTVLKSAILKRNKVYCSIAFTKILQTGILKLEYENNMLKHKGLVLEKKVDSLSKMNCKNACLVRKNKCDSILRTFYTYWKEYIADSYRESIVLKQFDTKKKIRLLTTWKKYVVRMSTARSMGLKVKKKNNENMLKLSLTSWHLISKKANLLSRKQESLIMRRNYKRKESTLVVWKDFTIQSKHAKLGYKTGLIILGNLFTSKSNRAKKARFQNWDMHTHSLRKKEKLLFRLNVLLKKNVALTALQKWKAFNKDALKQTTEALENRLDLFEATFTSVKLQANAEVKHLKDQLRRTRKRLIKVQTLSVKQQEKLNRFLCRSRGKTKREQEAEDDWYLRHKSNVGKPLPKQCKQSKPEQDSKHLDLSDLVLDALEVSTTDLKHES